MENTPKKVALVTGGTSGIGLAAANLLREKGCVVYTLSRSKSDSPYHLSCDVCDEEGCKAAVNALLAGEGRLDILLHCAGYGISGAGEFTPMEKAERQLRVNLLGTANMVNAAIPPMRAQGGGRMVLTGSVAGLVPIPFQTWYACSKAALNSYTMSMANELRPFGITLCAVLPGDTATGFTAARDKVEAGDEVYGGVIRRSVGKMEADEQKGGSPQAVAALMVRCGLKKRVKPFYIPGFGYKCAGVLMRLLPSGPANRLIGLLYAH